MKKDSDSAKKRTRLNEFGRFVRRTNRLMGPETAADKFLKSVPRKVSLSMTAKWKLDV